MQCVVGRLALVVGGCALLLVACGKSGAGTAGSRGESVARSVRLAPVELRSVERVIVVTGTLAAQQQSTLSSKVTGRLQSLAVDLGSVVRRGDLLAQVEPRDYELRLQQAAAALSQARSELGLPLDGDNDRVELEGISSVKQAKAVFEEATKNRERILNLSKSGIASQSELDSVEVAYKVALSSYEVAQDDARTRTATLAQRRAEYEIARKQLADASLLAPFDGAVQSRPASAGEYVAPGTPIVTLVQIDPLRLRLEVPERESMFVRLAQSVRLRIEGDTNIHTGRIARLAPAITELNRMLQVEADVPNRGALRPGLFARAEIIINDRDPALAVPANALTMFAGIEKVVAVKDGKALEKIVTTGRRGADWVEILSGVTAGESVVLDPGGLRSGQPVTVEPASQRQTPEATVGSTSDHPRTSDAKSRTRAKEN